MFNQNGGSRTDTLIKLVLVFFLSLLSFSVGTFVGKQFSDSQHKIADLETGGAETDRSTASIPPDVNKVEPGQAISEEEISKLSDEFVKKEKGAAVQEKNSAQNEEGSHGLAGEAVGENKEADKVETEGKKETSKKREAGGKTVSVHDEIANVSKRIANGNKVAAPAQAAPRIPASLPKELANSSIGKFTVQISSHPTEDEAKTEASELKEKGFSAFYVPAPVNGKTWYRVSVGLFDNKKEASEFRTKLMKEAKVSSAIIQKISQN